MRWWRMLPIPMLILAAGLVGILQLRDQAGTESGYLLAGASLILAGLWAAQALLGNNDQGGNMGDVTKALKDQTEAINDLVEAIEKESAKIVTAVNARDAIAAEAIAKAIGKRTQQILDITEKVTSGQGGQDLPETPDKPNQGLPTGSTGPTGGQELPNRPTGATGGSNRPDQGLPETPEPKS